MNEPTEPPRDYAMPASEHPGNFPKRRPRRRRGWLGWYGFPSRADAAFHARMIRLHFLSLIGWRA